MSDARFLHVLTVEERDLPALPRILGYIADAIDQLAATVETGCGLLASNPEVAAFLSTIAYDTRIAAVAVQARVHGEALDVLTDAILARARAAGLTVEAWVDSEIERGTRGS